MTKGKHVLKGTFQKMPDDFHRILSHVPLPESRKYFLGNHVNRAPAKQD